MLGAKLRLAPILLLTFWAAGNAVSARLMSYMGESYSKRLAPKLPTRTLVWANALQAGAEK